LSKYFLLDTRLNGTYIYIVTEALEAGVKIDRITHCYNEDFEHLIAILIKDKEVYKVKVLASLYNEYVISKLKNLNNIEIEVIESL
jgi:hypothetical protein